MLVSFFCAVCVSLRGTGGGVLLAELRCELVQVFQYFFLAFEERLEEVCLRGRQVLRPHGHGLDVFLERFGFCKSVFHGAVEDRLGFCGLLTFFLLVKKSLASS